MNSSRGIYSASVAIEMRAPLARVELAASELMRGAATPIARELSAGIREAVADLDHLIAKLITMWVPPSAGEGPVDVATVLHKLHERLSAVMNARGIIFDLSISSKDTVTGDGEAAREVALALLRAGALLVGPGGRIDLMATAGLDRFGIRLMSWPQASRKSNAMAHLDAILDELRASMMGLGAWVEREGPAGKIGPICVWVPNPEAACNGS